MLYVEFGALMYSGSGFGDSVCHRFKHTAAAILEENVL